MKEAIKRADSNDLQAFVFGLREKLCFVVAEKRRFRFFSARGVVAQRQTTRKLSSRRPEGCSESRIKIFSVTILSEAERPQIQLLEPVRASFGFAVKPSFRIVEKRF